MTHATTPWERQETSEATRKHLGLGELQVWARMVEGLARFVLLPPGASPGPFLKGYISLDMALVCATEPDVLVPTPQK